jgi:hypothetical protein
MIPLLSNPEEIIFLSSLLLDHYFQAICKDLILWTNNSNLMVLVKMAL